MSLFNLTFRFDIVVNVIPYSSQYVHGSYEIYMNRMTIYILVVSSVSSSIFVYQFCDVNVCVYEDIAT